MIYLPPRKSYKNLAINGYKAEFVEDATYTYNCHFYGWYMESMYTSERLLDEQSRYLLGKADCTMKFLKKKGKWCFIMIRQIFGIIITGILLGV